MNTTCRTAFRSILAAVALAAVVSIPSAAHAWWRGGWGIGFGFAPFYYPPPVYVAPPVYYPPPAAYPPAAYPQQGPAGPACYAGPYVCPLDKAAPQGSPCSCPTNNNGRAGGQVG
jgi:hypothetical protein